MNLNLIIYIFLIAPTLKLYINNIYNLYILLKSMILLALHFNFTSY